MASTLLGGRGRDRITDKGRGTDAPGPSDTSDSAADIAGVPGAIGGDHGTNEAIVTQGPFHTAGPDIGDDELEKDAEQQ